MKGHVCKVCGFISIEADAPDKCPVCGAPKTAFRDKENAINEPKDTNNLTELEKKHIPVISPVKKCNLITEGCEDVHVKMGQIQHPMQEDHYIMLIDFYLDKKFIARAHLTPEKLNPAATLHLKPTSGKLTVIEHCNLHGNWMSEIDL